VIERTLTVKGGAIMTLQTPTRWYPYLGDAVSVRRGSTTLTGYASKSDDTVVEVDAPLPDLALGSLVDAAWRVGDDVHRCDATVEELLPGGAFSVRLGPPRPALSRRTHQRFQLSVPLSVEPLRGGSVAPVVTCKSIDVSRGGLRAELAGTDLRIGDLVALDVSLGMGKDEVYGRVVWQDWPSFGHALAGVRFEREIELEEWYARLAS
jgi:hypothetical protein